MNHALGFLEDERLSYLGFSYGTVLGATFAALYPEKIDRMVLDGVVDDRQYYDAEKDPAFDVGDIDEALQICFEACHDAGPEACAFWHNNADEIRRSCFEADRILQSRPLPVANCGLLKAPMWRSAVYQAMYKPAEYARIVASVAADIHRGVA